MSILLQQQSQASMKTFSFASTVLTFLIVCAFCYAPLGAQTLDSTKADSVQKPRENWYWLSGGWLAVAHELAASVAIDYHVFKFRYTGIGYWGFAFPPATSDFGLLYGLNYRKDWGFASLSVGPAYTYRVPSEFEKSLGDTGYKTIGLAWEIHLAAKTPYIGLGVTLLGNLNSISPNIAVILTTHLGWMP